MAQSLPAPDFPGKMKISRADQPNPLGFGPESPNSTDWETSGDTEVPDDMAATRAGGLLTAHTLCPCVVSPNYMFSSPGPFTQWPQAVGIF